MNFEAGFSKRFYDLLSPISLSLPPCGVHAMTLASFPFPHPLPPAPPFSLPFPPFFAFLASHRPGPRPQAVPAYCQVSPGSGTRDHPPRETVYLYMERATNNGRWQNNVVDKTMAMGGITGDVETLSKSGDFRVVFVVIFHSVTCSQIPRSAFAVLALACTCLHYESTDMLLQSSVVVVRCRRSGHGFARGTTRGCSAFPIPTCNCLIFLRPGHPSRTFLRRAAPVIMGQGQSHSAPP